MKFRFDDVTSQTTNFVDTAVCRWQPEPRPGSPMLDCLCAVDATGQLILFERSDAGEWQSWNLSQSLDRLFSRVQPVHRGIGGEFFKPLGPSDAVGGKTDVLLLPDEGGHLVLCHRQQDGSWVLVDISVDCEVLIDRACRPLIWEERFVSGESLHLLAVSTDGELVEFFQRAGQTWQCHRTGASSTPGSLSLFDRETRMGDASLDAHAMVFSVSVEGLLHRHMRQYGQQRAWRDEQISASDSPRLRTHSTAVFEIDGQCCVAVCDVFGSVLIYQQPVDDTDRQAWAKTDVSKQTGCRVRAVGSAMVLSTETQTEVGAEVRVAADECKASTGSSRSVILTAHGQGRAYRFWWNEEERWQVTDLEEAVGLGTRLSAHPGLTDSQDESLAMVFDKRLILCEGLESLRSMSRRLLGGIPNRGHPVFSRSRTLSSRIVAFHDGPVPELRAIGEAVFGSRAIQRNATSYLDYVSGGAFTLQRDDVVGWLSASDASLPEKYDSSRESNVETQLTSQRVRQRFQQAIHEEPAVGSVGVIDLNSRLIIAAHNGCSPALSNSTQQVLWPINGSISVIRLLQELLATCAQLPRLPLEGPEYDLMSLDVESLGDSRFLHPNGAWKLLLGWVRPRMAIRAMRYRLRAVADSHEVIVLARDVSGSIEYFVIENRQYRPMDDISAPGLLVWHVLNQCCISSVLVESVDTVPGWKVTLVSAITGAATSSDQLIWADGVASGYTLHNVSSSADVMSFDLGLETGH